MPPYDVFAKMCPSRAVFEHVTGKWGALVLGSLNEGPHRFGEIRDQVQGISDRMLTQTLKTLCDDGIAVRTMSSHSHPTYELTEAGVGVAAAVRTLITVVEDAMSRGIGGR
ncbi:helix-turn-helix domain-containing protein [Gordonia humi]